MKPIIVTNCTNRKRANRGQVLGALPHLEGETVEEYAKRWLECARNHPAQVFPEDLYCGRGYGEAMRAAEKLDADMYTISAGFGLLAHNHSIPPYNFTLSDLGKLTPRPSEWWSAIHQARAFRGTLTETLMDESVDVAFFSISTSYMRLIEKELLSLPSQAIKKLRLIIGYEPPRSLREFTIKYDARLDGPDSALRGTRADFNSRALRHLVENVVLDTKDHSVENYRALVSNCLAPMRAPSIPKRQKASDEEIKILIKEYWDEAGGRSSSALRLLRDKAGVACEQGRFAELFRQVIAQ